MKLSVAYNWPYILKNTLERAFFVHQISLEGRIVHKFIVSTTQMDEEITMYTVSYSLSLRQLRIITLLELSEQQLTYIHSNYHHQQQFLSRSELKKTLFQFQFSFWRFLFENRVIELSVKVKQNAKIRVFKVYSLLSWVING